LKLAICCINALGWATVRHRWQQIFAADPDIEVKFFFPETYIKDVPHLRMKMLLRGMRMRLAVQDAVRWGAGRILIATNGEASLLPDRMASKFLIYGDASHRQLTELYRFERSERKNLRREGIMARLAEHGSRMVGMSRWAADGMARDYRCEASLLPPAINTELFRPREESRAPGSTRILFVGGDFDRKGGQLLVDALEQLPDCELHCITKGSVPSHPRLKLIAHQPPDSPEVVRAFQSCDIFCLPTLADCYSHVAIEAQACGLPVLIHPTGGIADITESGRSAAHIEPTTESIVNAVQALIDDPQRRADLAERGRQRVLEENAYAVHRTRLMELLS